MNRYLDFENEVETIENQINELNIHDDNFSFAKNKLLEKKKQNT